jgi:hypothetical protein
MKFEHHLILHILFNCGLTTIVMVGGLAIEDKYNGFIKARDYVCRSKPKTLDEQEQQIQDTFATIPLDLYKKSVQIVSSRL